MWFFNWAPGWIWIMPLLMLGVFVACMLLMFSSRCGGGCRCCGGTSSGTDAATDPDQS